MKRDKRGSEKKNKKMLDTRIDVTKKALCLHNRNSDSSAMIWVTLWTKNGSFLRERLQYFCGLRSPGCVP